VKIQLKRAHIQNFRSIQNAVIDFEQFSILFGKNDTGKSNLLYALRYAFSGGSFSDEDIFSSPQCPFTREKRFIIDVMFVPVDDKGARVKTFDDLWGLHLGENVVTDTNDYEFFAFRVSYFYDKEKDAYVWERNLINSWNGDDIISGKGIGFQTLSAFDYIFLDAQRDIALDIRDKNSLWNRQIANIQMSEEIKTSIESSLMEMGNIIKAESPFLQEVEKDLSYTINNDKTRIEVSPIARNINELYKGLDIYVAPESSNHFSISKLGLGTRSKAVFSILKTIIKKRSEASQTIPYFCILALEEPEAHIYPHSQQRLIYNFKQIEGQKIVTTHSPYLLTALPINNLIHVSLNGGESNYIPIARLNLRTEELRKINRSVLNTRGDILFSNITILAEGETEEQALSVFFQNYFNKTTFELGVNIVGVGGMGRKYLPFLQILETLGVKWFIFSDGEAKTLDDLEKTIQELTKSPEKSAIAKFDNIVITDHGDYETSLVKNNYQNEIITAINSFEDESKTDGAMSYFDSFMARYLKQNPEHDADAALVKCMKSGKAKYAAIIAQTICALCAEDRRFPPKIKELMDEIKSILIEAEK
jgi:putative ATP-dependent endonuclease of OLD family